MSIYRRRGWLLSYFLEISQCGSQGIMMMAFDYVISPSAPNSSDHSTYYEGIHMWSGIIYGRVQTCFVLTRNISWLIFISSIFRRFYFPCISEALEMKNMIKWRRAHIPLVFIYTTATMFSTVDIVYSCSKSEHSVEFSSLFRGFGFHAWKMVLERKEWCKAKYNWNIDCASNTWDLSMQSVITATMLTTMDYVLHSVPRIINSKTINFQGIWFPYMLLWWFWKVMVQAGWSSIQ